MFKPFGRVNGNKVLCCSRQRFKSFVFHNSHVHDVSKIKIISQILQRKLKNHNKKKLIQIFILKFQINMINLKKIIFHPLGYIEIGFFYVY